MAKSTHETLSRRERQIMDILYRSGRASAHEVLAALPDPPSYSACRALLRILETKGHVKHEQEGPRYVFSPRQPRDRARRSALRRVVDTFFEGSAERAMVALLDSSEITSEELERLSTLIEEARNEGR
jgi:predicted transcriptional regulator